MRRLLILSAVGLIGCSGGGNPNRPSPTPSPVTLSGQLRATNSGQPIAGATIQVPSGSATTNADGRFTLSVLPAAAIHARITGPQEQVVRLRGHDPEARQLIAAGVEHSPTFAALVLALEETDLVVFVETALLRGETASVRLMGAGPRVRYLRIRLATPQTANRLIALLGHELQHALEIGHSAARTDATIADLFRAIGHPVRRPGASHDYETDHARRVQQRVLDEVFAWQARPSGRTLRFRDDGPPVTTCVAGVLRPLPTLAQPRPPDQHRQRRTATTRAGWQFRLRHEVAPATIHASAR